MFNILNLFVFFHRKFSVKMIRENKPKEMMEFMIKDKPQSGASKPKPKPNKTKRCKKNKDCKKGKCINKRCSRGMMMKPMRPKRGKNRSRRRKRKRRLNN